MSQRYRVSAYDCTGAEEWRDVDTLREASEVASEWRRRYGRDRVVIVSRPENVDLGCGDGLSDEERDELEALDHDAETIRGLEACLREAEATIAAIKEALR